MHEALQALIGLQEIDRDIYRVQAELRRLPAERNVRQAAIDQQTERIKALQDEIVKLRTHIKEIEDQTTIQRQRMRKTENEANQSRGDVALLAAFQHQIRTLKREISNTEEEGLELLDRAETLDTEAAELQEALDAELAVFAEFSKNVDAEIAEAQGRLDALEARRVQRSSSEVKPQDLTLYKRLLDAREGVALAELDGLNCQGCYMAIPPNLRVRLTRGADLVQCPSCDRILYHRH